MSLSAEDERLFLEALTEAGQAPYKDLALAASGKLVRYRLQDEKSGKTSGWYILFSSAGISVGAFGNWKTDETHKWCSKSEQTLSPQERELWRRRQQEAQQARAAEQIVVRQQACDKAVYLEGIAQLAATNQHPYLITKQVKPYGLKILKKMLLVPLRNATGAMTSLQFIQEDGSKRFLTGGEITGSYFAIGNHKSRLCICEGFATGASIFEATGFRVVVAFNAGNLAAVAKVMREKFPDFTIIICADNDVKTDVNTGLKKAADAAVQIHAMLAVAKFRDADLIDGKVPTDFNDLHRLQGLEAVREVIEGAVEAPEQPAEAAKTEVKSAKQLIKEFEALIEESDDFDFLTVELLGRLVAAELAPPAIQHLASKIAKKADVPKWSLMEVINGYRNTGKTKRLGDYEDKIDETNLKHAVLPMGGRQLILNRDYDPVMCRHLFTFSGRADFELRYCNRRVYDKGEEMGLGTYWLKHPRRAEFDGMVFSPGVDQPGYLNLWGGWGVEPVAGECQRYLDFVFDVICSGDGPLFDYIVHWLAHMVQRPQEMPETALVLRGREGIGKNKFVEWLQDIVGREHYLPLASMNQITGRFSGHLATSVLVFCNESVWGGDKSSQGKLKSLITDDVQSVEYKGRDVVTMKSYLRVIFATNEDWAVPRGLEDRRYVIIDVSDVRKRDFEYFKELLAEREAGGRRH